MIKVDIVIVGAGIAGLWILNRVKALGYSAILLESNELGGGQTNKSQGIIHGGMKYALSGNYTPAAKAISTMPERWNNCLSGKGEIDLTSVPVLSNEQYLWAEGKLTGKLTNIFANLALKSKITPTQKSKLPKIFQNKNFKGQVSTLNESVIDVNKLVSALANKYFEFIFKADSITIETNSAEISNLIINKTLNISAQKFIFTAGNGNKEILNKLEINSFKMQQRPLHMVLVKHKSNDPIYAHLLGLSNVPKITITTHKAKDGKTIWYLGGQLAEDGINKSAEEQIEKAKKELTNYFSWLDFTNAEFKSFMINRAENFEGEGKKPDSFFMQQTNNYIVAWPTKLAFAPLLTDSILKALNISPLYNDVSETKLLAKPKIANPIWDDLYA